MRTEIENLLGNLQVNFAINDCEIFEESCPDCRATRLFNDLKWWLTLQD